MPNLRKKKAIAIACADIHLSHTPPIARAVEKDWYAAQARPLRQLCKLAHDLGNVPVLCAGDIFDKWHSPAELISFAISELPRGMISIPGNHDTPEHRLDQIKRSAYWTLVKSGTIQDITYKARGLGTMSLYGYPDGLQKRKQPTAENSIALAHEYIWKKGKGYPNAPHEQLSKFILPKAKKFALAIYGDNHKGFESGNIYNCGGLQRRNIDEIESQPAVGIIYSDFTIKRHHLDVKHDQFSDTGEAIKLLEQALDLSPFLAELKSATKNIISFEEAVRKFCKENEIGKAITGIIFKALENK